MVDTREQLPERRPAKRTVTDLDGLMGRKRLVIGIDPGLLKPAIAVLCPDDWTAFLWRFESQDRGVRRLCEIERFFEDTLSQIRLRCEDVLQVCVERPSFGSPWGSHQLGEAHAVIKLALVRTFGINSLVAYPAFPTPSQVKKFATSSGATTVKKSEILKSVYKKWGVDLSNDDEADAYTLARIAAGLSVGSSSLKYEQEVIDALEKHDEWDIQPKPAKRGTRASK